MARARHQSVGTIKPSMPSPAVARAIPPASHKSPPILVKGAFSRLSDESSQDRLRAVGHQLNQDGFCTPPEPEEPKLPLDWAAVINRRIIKMTATKNFILIFLSTRQDFSKEACGWLRIFRRKNKYTVTQAKPTARIKRSQMGQEVCQIHKPSATGKTSDPTISWTIKGQLRKDYHLASSNPRLKISATPKSNHKRVRTENAKMLIIRFVIGNLL